MDKLIMENYLLVLKSTMEVYVHGTLEASNNDIKDLFKKCMDDLVEHQRDTYDTMVEFGWYQVNNVEEKIIKQTLKTIENKN